MSTGLYTQLLYLTGGGLLLTSVLMLWRRQLAALIRLLTVQGVLLAGLAALLGTQNGGAELFVVAFVVLILKSGVLPAVLRRALADSGDLRETQPLVNVPASLLAAAVLTLLAYAVSRPLVELDPTPTAARRELQRIEEVAGRFDGELWPLRVAHVRARAESAGFEEVRAGFERIGAVRLAGRVPGAGRGRAG